MDEVIVARDQSINRVLDLMKKSGLNEESAMKKIINMASGIMLPNSIRMVRSL
jgi:hypothetical protein